MCLPLLCLPPSPARGRWLEQGEGGRALVPECSHAGHVLALYLATRGDLVVVGACCWRAFALWVWGWVCEAGCTQRWEGQAGVKAGRLQGWVWGP